VKKKALSNSEVRVWYKNEVAKLPALARKWKKEGITLAQRAKNAWKYRQEKRLEAREMMSDREAVELLRLRDLKKYGTPDGPTFEMLMKRLQDEGYSENEAYEEIIKKAVRTDKATNKKFDV
jgi:hypothetical protein